MSHARTFAATAALAGLVFSFTAAASGPTFWTVASADDFLKGTSDGVYVSLAGTVTAGPPLTNRLSTTPAQIWSIAETADGTLWAGTGSDGRLVRIRPGQNSEETVFDSPEANVFAVATSGTRVFAASSPDGKVYVVDGTAPARVFFDPEEKYIWALAVDGAGRLWVGAGNPAAIYRVSPDGTSQVVYRPPTTHVVTLALDRTGRMLAGTESPGRLYRFDQNDRPFVLLDTGLAELRAVDAAPNGVVFAAGVAKGDESGGGETTSVAVTLAPPPSSSGSPASSSSTAAATPRRSVVYRIDSNGTWEEVWTTGDVVYDLASDGAGVLVATGPEGRLYRIDGSLDVSLFTGVDSRQITRFARANRDATVAAFATANPGRIVSVGTGVQTPARYVSSVRDTKSVATWGLLRWEASGPMRFSTRSGNTDRPDDSWSDWSAPYTRSTGEAITSPAARFVQWRAEFPASGSSRPALSAVTLAYLPRNNRPVVSSVTVHPPGLVFQRPFVNDESAIAGLDDAALEARRPPGDTGPTVPAPGRRMFQKGLQTIGWKAEDEDDDQLLFTLQYRHEDETEWRDLKTNATGSMFVWDTTTVADGRYFVRVRASDSPSNAGDRALIGDREGEPIPVDNTPPRITVAVVRDASGVRLDVRVEDQRSPIERLEYSVNGGAWQSIYPVDGLADAPDERFEIRFPAGTNPASVVLRAVDLLQNVASQPAAAR